MTPQVLQLINQFISPNYSLRSFLTHNAASSAGAQEGNLSYTALHPYAIPEQLLT